MTAISALQSIHKKGLFGDHHKKNESDLLNILEVKDLTIVQVSQYKKSKLHLKSISVDRLELSLQKARVSSNKDTRIIWSGPNTWFVVSKKENIIEIINKDCDSEDFAITDISHSRAVMQIKGPKAIEVLKKGCPINFNEFNKNECAGSVFHGINIVVDCIDNNPLTLNIFTLRSFGESLYHHITDASLEFGYVGI
jgi:sarcosine oxidase subunit gamma